MKAKDLRPCDGCGDVLTSNGVPMFYRVRVETMGVNVNAVRRQVGLSMMMGNSALAAIMGPDEDMASPVFPAEDVLLCLQCAMATPVAVAQELAEKRKKAPDPA